MVILLLVPVQSVYYRQYRLHPFYYHLGTDESMKVWTVNGNCKVSGISGSTRITITFIIPFIWIAHPCSWLCYFLSFTFLVQRQVRTIDLKIYDSSVLPLCWSCWSHLPKLISFSNLSFGKMSSWPNDGAAWNYGANLSNPQRQSVISNKERFIYLIYALGPIL